MHGTTTFEAWISQSGILSYVPKETRDAAEEYVKRALKKYNAEAMAIVQFPCNGEQATCICEPEGCIEIFRAKLDTLFPGNWREIKKGEQPANKGSQVPATTGSTTSQQLPATRD